jgi:16S rRNA (guanine1207-N2)-methyltransferase
MSGRARTSQPRDRSHPAPFGCADDRYGQWRTEEVQARGRTLALVSKPGVFAHGGLDPAAGLLLDHVKVADGDAVVVLNDAGIVAAYAALAGARVWTSDRSVLSAEAARRTAEANGVAAEVVHGHGTAAYTGPPADIVAVRLPQGKVPVLQLLWDAFHALRPGGRCYLAGGNDEGIKTALKQMEALFGEAHLLAYRGGHRVGVATRGEAPAGRTGDFDTPWLDPDAFRRFRIETRGGSYEVHSRPGVFSWDRFDRGSQALLEAADPGKARDVLELGCGYGIVGTALARLAPDARVTLVDVDAEAVRSARRTADANGVGERCETRAGDVAAGVPDASMDLVVANPPFHVGKATDLEVPAQFIRDAARVLRPRGRLLLVANRTLPYEAWVEACFGAVQTVHDGREFKVLGATRR